MRKTSTARADTAVSAFLAGIDDPLRRADCLVLCDLMSRVTGQPAAMWPGNIVGFGSYHYRYASGREGTAAATGFSPRKSEISIYLMAGSADQARLLASLGRHRMGKACLSIRRLADVDPDVLEQLVAASVAEVGSR